MQAKAFTDVWSDVFVLRHTGDNLVPEDGGETQQRVTNHVPAPPGSPGMEPISPARCRFGP